MTKTEKAALKLRSYRQDILKFVKDEFNVEPDRWQKKALLAFANHEHKIFRMSLQACAGPGKSAVLSWCGWWFLCTQGEKGVHPKGAAISVTWDNLKDNLWSEMSKWQQISPLCTNLFTWTQSRIFAKDHAETWFLSARSFAKTANAEEQGRTLSGVHSKYVLFLIDESGDIPVTVLKATEQALSTADKVLGRVLQAGNPTSTDGMLYAAQSTLAEKWHVIKITGDPDDPDRSPRIDIDWAREQIETYGRDDPWVMSYILGQFPKSGINSLLSVDEVDQAMARNLRPEDYEWAQKRLGIDVARFGYDSNVIFPRQGLRAYNFVEMRNARTPEIAARAMLAKEKWESEVEFVDGTGGYGAGVVDSMLQSGANPHEVNFAERASDPRYYNKRAEMWFRMAEWVRRGGVLPKSPGLKKELTAPTYSFKNGKFCLESKDQIKQRLGFSPDKADALCLTFALPDMPSNNSAEARLRQAGKYKFDYDPLA
jgi:phage terminase large subunit